MTAASVEASSLDPQTLMLVRIAALVAVDAPPSSYLLNLGAAAEIGVDGERVRDVLAVRAARAPCHTPGGRGAFVLRVDARDSSATGGWARRSGARASCTSCRCTRRRGSPGPAGDGHENLTVVVSRPVRRNGAGLFPIVRWLHAYDRKWLRGDLAAGIAVTALIVPKDLGYAGIAGVPLQNGLYAAAAGAIIYALFCTSRQISTGPSSSLAAVAGGAVAVAGLANDQTAELVAAIALITGLLFLALAFLRLGWISRFLSKAVITGFLAGAAVDVVIGELPKLTGTDAEGKNAWRELGSWIVSLADVHWPTVVVGLLALGLILGLRFLAPAVPGALLLVVAGILAARLFDLEEYGVAVVGHVPSGLPTPQLPDLELITDNLATVVVAAVALVLIGFSQTAGDARAFAARHGYRIDIDQESVAQGMAKRRCGCLPGHAGLDEPLRELAERVGRSEDADGLADHGRARDSHVALSGAAVLGPPAGRPRGGDH
jgi:Sulfate permease family